MTLSGKVALVTGGSRGIGLAIARALLEQGARVSITATSDTTLRAGAADLAAISGSSSVLSIKADVRHVAEIEAAFDATAKRFGGVDVVVNNAAVGIFRPVREMSVDEWCRVIDTNLTGVFHCCRVALPYLQRRGGGWIINVSSLAGRNPFPAAAAYCASKAGVNAFTEALMQEVRHDGIRVACVTPGSVRTGFGGHTPVDDDWKLAPEDVASVITDLIGHPTRSLPSLVEIRPARPPKKS